jgi:signal transduction histidine kinase
MRLSIHRAQYRRQGVICASDDRHEKCHDYDMTLPKYFPLWYNGPMEDANLEPGFLQAFRLFIATRILFWAIIGPALILIQEATGVTPPVLLAEGAGIVENLSPANTSRMIAVDLVLLLLLLLPQVPRRLGRWFVPLTLLIALVPLLIGYFWWPSGNPLQTPFVIFFFVMLVLIAWQYPFSYVVGYVVGLSLYQYWIFSSKTDVPVGFDVVGWLVLQAVMMLLVGYVIVTLVSVQREQRRALANAYEHQAAANARLKRYAATVEELTISRERNRLARELHDTLAHSLSAVAVQLEAVRSLWDVDRDAAHAILDKADEAARTGLTEARRSLRDLRASPLQELGLADALRELSDSAAERSGTILELHIPEEMAELPPAVEQGIYRIAQEALENTVRHAGASTIVVSLEQRDDTLSLSINDDGQGADITALSTAESDDTRHLGILGMRERAELIGGELTMTSEGGQGTEIRLSVPI